MDVWEPIQYIKDGGIDTCVSVCQPQTSLDSYILPSCLRQRRVRGEAGFRERMLIPSFKQSLALAGVVEK